ncbi:MAG: hypothetical protein RL404_2406 [Pseudomonadota bacterium]
MKPLVTRHPERRRSLQRKLGLLNIAGLAVAGVLVCILLGTWSWFTQRADLIRNTESVARVLAENAAPAIQFNDPVGAAEILRALASHPEVMAAELVASPEATFARYQWPRRPLAGPIEGLERLLPIGERSVDVIVPVEAQGLPLGLLKLTVDLSPTYARVYASLTAILAIVGAVFGVVLVLQSRVLASMLAPVRQLVDSMRRVSETADYSQRAFVASQDEIGELGETFNAMMGLIQERDEAMEHLALHDSLTGLHNRHYLRIRARSPVLDAGDRCALFYIDIDNFKQINDNLDHNVGDRVLISVASRLSDVAGEDDLLVRFGGDEFVFCAYGLADNADVNRIADRLRNAIAEPVFIDGRELTARASVGIALAPAHGDTMDELLQKADAAMHVAKENGRDQVQLWNSAISQRANHRFELEADLRQAIAERQLAVAYQPIIDLQDGRVIGMEALARWNHPRRGWVSPAEFIPVAEDSGLILAIGAWVMEQACLQVRQWHTQFGPLFVAVNVSARQFRDPELVRKVSAICLDTHFPFDLMHLEITESTLVNDADAAADIMHALVNLGFRLSLDDFGTGYSSLSYLKRFPVHKLKIDQSFVKDLPRNADDGAIVKAIVTLGRALDIKVLAEGIETDSQHAVLSAMGCDQGQGYFYSQPLWARDFESFVFNRHQMLVVAPAGQASPRN